MKSECFKMLCFYRDRKLQFPYAVILIFISVTLQHSDALVGLPQNLRVDSEVEVNNSETYSVEELIDRRGGSVHLKVSDISNPLKTKESISYYRLKELNSGSVVSKSLIVSYSHKDLLCQLDTTDKWRLKDLTHIISLLLDSIDSPEMAAIKKDRTAIGPNTLFQILMADAQSFSLEQLAFEESHLNDMYYFVSSITLHQHNQVIKIICSFSRINIGIDLQPNITLLSVVDNIWTYPSSITAVVLNKAEAEAIDLKSLISGKSDKLKATRRVVANFYLMQERLPSRHLGNKLGSLDETNPFSLPSGSGCASFIPVFINAKQFSGRFTAKDFKAKRFIAYDSISDHLRLDLIGKYKMIYDLKQRRTTYIDDTSSLTLGDEDVVCAQSYSQDSDQNDELHDIISQEHILGLGKSIGLQYLGTKSLEDGSHCVVYEREIIAKKIPLLSRLNLRIGVRDTNRYFLVYYFVDEIAVENRDSDESIDLAYERLWLKRLELKSVSPVSKYKILNSQVTFSEFSWSLEAESTEDMNNYELGLSRPVRTFDTLSCRSARDQTQLEFLVRQVNALESQEDQRESSIDQRKARSEWSEKQIDWNQVFSDRLDFVEESVMQSLAQVRDLSRSQINELEVVPAQNYGTNATSLIRAKLIEPMAYTFERKFVGWIHNIDSMPFEKYGTFLSSDSMLRYECSLRLATQKSNFKQIYMIYCPNQGCGFTHDLSAFNMTYNTPVNTDPDYYQCEVHEQVKEVATSEKAAKLPLKFIEKLGSISIDTDPIGSTKDSQQSSGENVFKGKVTKSSLRTGHSLGSPGIVLLDGMCYTNETTTDKPLELDLKVQNLKFAIQHSLIHCHKACQMYAGCQTYSFDKVSKVCTMTSINKRIIEGNIETVKGLENNSQCTIYALDSLQLYTTVLETMLNSLDGLSKRKNMGFYVGVMNLTECANLCHMNMFNCERFEFFLLDNYCFLEDKYSYIFKSLHPDLATKANSPSFRLNMMTDLVGRKQWITYHRSQQYKRDYHQHYAIEHSSKTDMENDNVALRLSQKLSSPKVDYKLIMGPTYYGLDPDDCLRECSLLNLNCIMADHCIAPVNAIPTKVCFTYELSDATHQLTSNNNSLSSERNPPKPQVQRLISSSGCTHYHLDGDNLWLKAKFIVDFQLYKSNLNEGKEEDVIERKDVELRGSHWKEGHDPVSSRNQAWTMLLPIVALVAGSVLALHTSPMTSMVAIQRIKSYIINASSDLLNQRRVHSDNQSQSVIDFTELNEMHSGK